MSEQDKWLQLYIRNIDKRLNDLDDKVDKLLAFKWQIVSGSVVLSVIFTAAIQVATLWLSK